MLAILFIEKWSRSFRERYFLKEMQLLPIWEFCFIGTEIF